MKNLTIILPLHEYNEKLLVNSLSSVKETFSKNITLMFVGENDIISKAENLSKKIGLECKIIKTENSETDFCTQVNKAVFACTTQYFSVLEYDDEYMPYIGDIYKKFMNNHNELSVVLPINEYYNEAEMFLSFGNEIAWDASFASVNKENGLEKLGYVTIESLDIFMDFNCTGGIFKTEDFISLGGLNGEYTIAAWYDYLLKVTSNKKNIYVLPRVGYAHTIGRTDSYSERMREKLQGKGNDLISEVRSKYTEYFNNIDDTENEE